jgi:hypothetical protein
MTGSDSAILTWTNPAAPPTVVNVTVAWGTTYGIYTATASEGVVQTTTVTGLTPNTTYYFVAWAWSGGGAGPLSNVAPAHTFALSPPVIVPPILSAVATGATTAEVAWTAGQNVTYGGIDLAWNTVIPPYLATWIGADAVCSGSGCLTLSGATVTGLSSNSTYYFFLMGSVGGNWVTLSNVAPVHTWPVDVGKTVWVNTTTFVNTTHVYYHNSTNWVNTTTFVNHNTTTFVNYSFYRNTTVFQNVTVNRTLFQNVTAWVNTTTFVNGTVYVNTSVYHNATVYVNTTVTNPLAPFPWGWVTVETLLIAIVSCAITYSLSKRHELEDTD